MNQKLFQNIHTFLSNIRYILKQSNLLVYTYLIFLGGFFLSPNNHLHRNFYYLCVIFPFFIGLDSKRIQDCLKNKLFQFSLIFLLYFWASMFWTHSHLSGEEYYDLSRYFLMLVFFIMMTITLASESEKFFDGCVEAVQVLGKKRYLESE